MMKQHSAFNFFQKTFFAIALASLGMSAVAQPVSRVQFSTFELDQTEVTIGQFRSFTQAKSLTTTAEREGGGFEYSAGWTRRSGWTYLRPQGKLGADNEPAVHVTWHEAKAYCAYAGGRLPSMIEWRNAAYTEQRAQPLDGYEKGRTYNYPVGDQPDGMNNNRRSHIQVGTSKRGVNGLYDMGANVWEWVADRQAENALTAGGSWWYGPEHSRSDGAQWKSANFLVLYIGFRCAYDLQSR